MVIPPRPHPRRRTRGSLSIELTVAIGILVTAILPLSVSFAREQAMMLGLYHRAVAIEVIDGEMEILAAGEWRAFPPGSQPYAVKADAARNLPPGTFTLTLTHNHARLEWMPASRGNGGPVVREVALPTAPTIPEPTGP